MIYLRFLFDYVKNLMINNKLVKIQLWDTAGQEQYSNLIRSYFIRAYLIITYLIKVYFIRTYLIRAYLIIRPYLVVIRR